MYIIQLNNGSYLESLSLAGKVKECKNSSSARKFLFEATLKNYTDFLEASAIKYNICSCRG
jgi:hypothetical protein